MTNDVKSVCKIEKKSYLLSFLRFKLNPYFYRFFKRIIYVIILFCSGASNRLGTRYYRNDSDLNW